jgi:choline-sulfatase
MGRTRNNSTTNSFSFSTLKIRTGFFLCTLVSLSLFGKAPDKRTKRLNILFLMSDQHRGDFLGAAGANWVKTPNLDKLAREGVNFTRAYSSVPSCLPARTSLLTGMSPWQSGQLGYNNIPAYPFEGPAMLTEAGYRTHAVGKNHFTPMRNRHGYQTVELEEGWYTAREGQEKCDYTLWFEKNAPGQNINASGLGYNDNRGGICFPFEESLHPTTWTANRAVEFLKTYREEAPWMLKVSFQRPHCPYDPPQRWYKAYQEVDPPKPSIGDWAETKYGVTDGTFATDVNASHGVFPPAEITESRRSYAASISFMDEQLGSVLEALKARGELENTLILYTSDHGDMLGDHYMWRKCRPYEGSARIPMIVRWPEAMGLKAKRGQTRNDVIELRDVLPTFLDAAGIIKPTVMDGRSMLDLLKGNKWRSVLDLEHAQIYEKDNAWVALTDGKYKYVYFTLTGQEQLFNLEQDPGEVIDLVLSGKNERILQIWRKKMVAHLIVRGEEWVKNCKLVVQKISQQYGPHHPKFGNPLK